MSSGIGTEVLRAACPSRARRRRCGQAAGDLIVASPAGKPLDECALVRCHFKAILAAAGPPVMIRLYDLRHTCATALLVSGENPSIIQSVAHEAWSNEAAAHSIRGAARPGNVIINPVDRLVEAAGAKRRQELIRKANEDQEEHGDVMRAFANELLPEAIRRARARVP